MADRTTLTAINPGSVVAVGNTSTPVVGINGGRINLLLTNDSDTVIYLRLATTGAALNSGLRIGVGETHFLEGYQGAMSAIQGGTGSKNLLVVEY